MAMNPITCLIYRSSNTTWGWFANPYIRKVFILFSPEIIIREAKYNVKLQNALTEYMNTHSVSAEDAAKASSIQNAYRQCSEV